MGFINRLFHIPPKPPHVDKEAIEALENQFDSLAVVTYESEIEQRFEAILTQDVTYTDIKIRKRITLPAGSMIGFEYDYRPDEITIHVHHAELNGHKDCVANDGGTDLESYTPKALGMTIISRFCQTQVQPLGNQKPIEGCQVRKVVKIGYEYLDYLDAFNLFTELLADKELTDKLDLVMVLNDEDTFTGLDGCSIRAWTYEIEENEGIGSLPEIVRF